MVHVWESYVKKWEDVMIVFKTVISTVDVILGMSVILGVDGKKNKIIAAFSSSLVVGLNLISMWT